MNNNRITEHLEVYSMNIRSLNKNKEAVAIILEQQQPAVLALQETWLQKLPPNLHGDYDRMSYLPKKNEGVAMYVRKDLRLKAIMHEEWNSNMMVVANG